MESRGGSLQWILGLCAAELESCCHLGGREGANVLVNENLSSNFSNKMSKSAICNSICLMCQPCEVNTLN